MRSPYIYILTTSRREAMQYLAVHGRPDGFEPVIVISINDLNGREIYDQDKLIRLPSYFQSGSTVEIETRIIHIDRRSGSLGPLKFKIILDDVMMDVLAWDIQASCLFPADMDDLPSDATLYHKFVVSIVTEDEEASTYLCRSIIYTSNNILEIRGAKKIDR